MRTVEEDGPRVVELIIILLPLQLCLGGVKDGGIEGAGLVFGEGDHGL